MQVTYDKKAGTLSIVLPVTEPRLSSTGTTYLVASEASPYGAVVLDGKAIRVQVNAMFKNPDAPAKEKGRK